MTLQREVLIQLFLGMTRKRREKVFFDILTPDILTWVDGYLSSNLGNQSVVNRVLAKRIIAGDRTDDIDRKGLYSIPRLHFNSFIAFLIRQPADNNLLKDLAIQFRRSIEKELPDGLDIHELCLTIEILQDFLTMLEKLSFENVDSYILESSEKAFVALAEEWLKSIDGVSSEYLKDDDVFYLEYDTDDFLPAEERFQSSSQPGVDSSHAFITMANLKKIVGMNEIDLRSVDERIYSRDITIFNTREYSRLISLKRLFENPDRFFKEFYRPIKSADSLKYIEREGPPAYHTFKDCERLNADFVGIAIPREIRARGLKEVNRFREWYKSNTQIHDREDTLQARIQLAFKTRELPEVVSHKNTGNTKINHTFFPRLERELDQMIDSIELYKTQSQRHAVIVEKFGKDSFNLITSKLPENDTPYSNLEIAETLREFHHSYKRPLESLLIEYFRFKNNPELKVETHVLKQLGFHYCRTCDSKAKLLNTNRHNLI